MRQNWLSNRVFKSFDDIVDHCCYACNVRIGISPAASRRPGRSRARRLSHRKGQEWTGVEIHLFRGWAGATISGEPVDQETTARCRQRGEAAGPVAPRTT